MLEINKIYNVDCLKGMKHIETGSIDLIVTDPPYGTVKGLGIKGWVMKNETLSWDIAIDPEILFTEYTRILREGGQLVIFSQEPYTSRLRTTKVYNFEFCYPLIWEKGHFANALISKKAPVNYFEDMSVFYKKYDLEQKNPIRQYSKRIFESLNMGKKEINKVLGHRKAEHFFYFDILQFKLPSKPVYEELIKVFKIDKLDYFMSYEKLLEINKHYEKVFNLPRGLKSKPNIFKYNKDYNDSWHPTQKPIKLLENLIKLYSHEGDLVLDSFMGGGSTAIACLNTNRNFIGFEADRGYCIKSGQRIKKHLEGEVKYAE